MSNDKTGGTAFPRPVSIVEHHDGNEMHASQDGMTLWDYFAGHALGGLLQSENGVCEDFAERAYDYADAMISERKKRGIE